MVSAPLPGTIAALGLTTSPHPRYCQDSVKLTRAGGARLWGESKSQQMLEIIEIPSLVKHYPSRTSRQHMVMLALCSGGVDYCYGLKKYGFDEQDLVPLTLEYRDTGFPIKWLANAFDPGDPYRRYLKFYPGLFISAIEPVWVSLKCKHLTLDEFKKELINILYCVTYFGGFDSQAARGGPPIPEYTEIELFPKVETMRELIDLVRSIKEDYEDPTDILEDLFPLYTIREEHPADKKTLSHSPEITYYGNQLESIRALDT